MLARPAASSSSSDKQGIDALDAAFDEDEALNEACNDALDEVVDEDEAGNEARNDALDEALNDSVCYPDSGGEEQGGEVVRTSPSPQPRT